MEDKHPTLTELRQRISDFIEEASVGFLFMCMAIVGAIVVLLICLFS